MRGKKKLFVLVATIIFAVGMITTLRPVKAATPTVKVYVDQPLGYIPFEAPGTQFSFDIKIETNGISDGTIDGIVQWATNIRVDPAVLSINTVPPEPPPFPPPPADASLTQGNFLATYAGWYGIGSNLLPGTADPTTGFWFDITEALNPNPGHGAGDYVSANYPILLTVTMKSLSDTQGCLIDLDRFEYRTADGNWHTPDIVEDGIYGELPTYLSDTGTFDPADPIGSTWHELYPRYCNDLVMTSFVDNGDGVLSPSDQVDFLNETDGWTYWYHVDEVTTTIHFTYKDPDTGTGDAEPVEKADYESADWTPIGSTWHMIYPDYSMEFVITSYDDNGDGTFGASDQIDFEFFGDGTVHWAHIDSVTVDLVLSFKEKTPPEPEFPMGIWLIMALAPAIPLIYVWRRRRWE